jgi:hypothetical protein
VKPPERIEVKPTHEGVKLIALGGDDLRYAAYRIAREFKSGRHYDGAAMLCSFPDGQRLPELLKLILEAYNDSGSFEPTATRRRIIEAYCAAAPFINGEAVTPTLGDVKKEFNQLYPKVKLPGNETFKRAFRELPFLREWRKRKGGRPRGSKDQDRRKRRNKIRSRKLA